MGGATVRAGASPRRHARVSGTPALLDLGYRTVVFRSPVVDAGDGHQLEINSAGSGMPGCTAESGSGFRVGRAQAALVA
jgi:hypothetical protein